MIADLSSVVNLPAKKGHRASRASVFWSLIENGWRAHEINSEYRTSHDTKLYASEEDCIRAARRREWVK